MALPELLRLPAPGHLAGQWRPSVPWPGLPLGHRARRCLAVTLRPRVASPGWIFPSCPRRQLEGFAVVTQWAAPSPGWRPSPELPAPGRLAGQWRPSVPWPGLPLGHRARRCLAVTLRPRVASPGWIFPSCPRRQLEGFAVVTQWAAPSPGWRPSPELPAPGRLASRWRPSVPWPGPPLWGTAPGAAWP